MKDDMSQKEQWLKELREKRVELAIQVARDETEGWKTTFRKIKVLDEQIAKIEAAPKVHTFFGIRWV